MVKSGVDPELTSEDIGKVQREFFLAAVAGQPGEVRECEWLFFLDLTSLGRRCAWARSGNGRFHFRIIWLCHRRRRRSRRRGCDDRLHLLIGWFDCRAGLKLGESLLELVDSFQQQSLTLA